MRREVVTCWRAVRGCVTRFGIKRPPERHQNLDLEQIAMISLDSKRRGERSPELKRERLICSWQTPLCASSAYLG